MGIFVVGIFAEQGLGIVSSRHIVVRRSKIGSLLHVELIFVFRVEKVLRVELDVVPSISAFLLMVHPEHVGNFVDGYADLVTFWSQIDIVPPFR